MKRTGKKTRAVELVGNLYYQETDKIILHEKAIIPVFFDLKNKLAGDILQKFSNYRMRWAILGSIPSRSSGTLSVKATRAGK